MTGPVQTSLEKTGPRPPVLSECQSDSSGDNIHELAATEHGLYNANAAADLGDFDTANKKARTARILIVAAVLFGIAIIPCAVAFRILALQST